MLDYTADLEQRGRCSVAVCRECLDKSANAFSAIFERQGRMCYDVDSFIIVPAVSCYRRIHMKKTRLPSDKVHNDPQSLQKAEDTEFWIKVVSSLIVMAVIVILVAAGKFAVKQINKYIAEESVSDQKIDTEIKMDFDTDTIITEEELKELNESLDAMRENFAESNS